ncbi:hypothetical protein [Halogeometricum luteum]|uniref:Uncharacterized protein n=1 Tax=Halogeometricum luteum TaxID=2950537 RepID=A0ABU2G469_9EURY|nr:hypothetical protein [Halogeometricum sp. S3BR5-2]MDS0295580.1 hypothetical protein [Halogeometricum sp. S3BR5-2]
MTWTASRTLTEPKSVVHHRLRLLGPLTGRRSERSRRRRAITARTEVFADAVGASRVVTVRVAVRFPVYQYVPT